MELALAAVVTLVLLAGTSIIAGRIGVAAPLLLVLLGIGIGYIPGFPEFDLDPEIILLGVLPPLLYSAAVNVPLVDLRRNAAPIAGLSVVLVVLTAGAAGWLLHLAVPDIPLPVAIALGAVIAPTDAVAATAVGKRVGMPPRLVTILEGESLVNDATALVLLRTAIAAVAGGFVFWDAAMQFAAAVAVAVLIGLGVGIVTVLIRSKLGNPIHDTVISFAVPFVSFVPTEALGGSGVLAVVVTGLYTGHHATRTFTAHARVTEQLNWRTVQFILENGVFLLMGVQLHTLVDEVRSSPLRLEHTALIALALVGVLILARGLFMIPVIVQLRYQLRGVESRAAGFGELADRAKRVMGDGEPTTRHLRIIERTEQLAKRSEADLAHARAEGLGWRGGLTLTWSGMRGVVTVAAAQSIPAEVPFRAQIVLIAFFVAALTLVIHGLTLPWVIRVLKPAGRSADDHRAELTDLIRTVLSAGLEAIDTEVERETRESEHDASHTPPAPATVDLARSSTKNILTPLASSVHTETEAAEHEMQAYFTLTRAAIAAQRDVLLEERAIGRYSSEAIRAVSAALDSHEARLLPPST